MKTNAIVLTVIGVLILLLVMFSLPSSSSKKKTDWSPELYNTKTIPYGTYITYNLLKEVFPHNNISTTRKPIEKTLFEYSDYYDSGEYGYTETYIDDEMGEEYSGYSVLDDTISYIFVNTDFYIDDADEQSLLNFVNVGNNVFIATEYFPSSLLQHLDLVTPDEIDLGMRGSYTLMGYDKREYEFENIKYRKRTFQIPDSSMYEVHALTRNEEDELVFIQVKYGEGSFYLHYLPVAFTNVNMVDLDKYDFAFRCLSYLPRGNSIIWDEFMKQGYEKERGNMFRVIFEHKSLTYAFWIAIIGCILLMIFRAKRTQRIIPILNPPVNTSLEFLDTIGNLYYRKKDYRSIILKRHTYFLDFIRTNYYMATEVVDEEFFGVLGAKTNVDMSTLKVLFNYHRQIADATQITEDVFMQYNTYLEEIYKTISIK